jgi:predicted acetyltransferase
VDIEIRGIAPDEDREFYAAAENAFGEVLGEELERLQRQFERERHLAAVEAGRIVGTAGSYTLSLSTPGASAAMAGVTIVAVLPTHRRRGVMTALMRRQLEDVRDRGEPLAGLWASESSIYGRFGYGVASLSADVRAERLRVDLRAAPQDDGSVHLAPRERALEEMPAIYDRGVERPGWITRPRPLWVEQAARADDDAGTDGPVFFALHETGGRTDGYAMYSVKTRWQDGSPDGTVTVRYLFGETPQAYAGIWRYVFGIDLMGTVQARLRPVDDPLLHMAADPRRISLRVSDGLYLRVIDVPAALAARRYATSGRLVIEVRDPFMGFAEGCFELNADPQGATCERTNAEPDLVMDVRDLGSIYLGGVSARSLAGAGRIRQEREGAVARAAAMFAAEAPPWCPYIF